MIALFRQMNCSLGNGIGFDEDGIDANQDNIHFYHFMMQHLSYDDTEIINHLPVPVFFIHQANNRITIYS